MDEKVDEEGKTTLDELVEEFNYGEAEPDHEAKDAAASETTVSTKPPAGTPSKKDSIKPPPTLMEEEGFDDKASVLADEKFTQERYEEIQAKTMWAMTDEVNDSKQRLLFLSAINTFR